MNVFKGEQQSAWNGSHFVRITVFGTRTLLTAAAAVGHNERFTLQTYHKQYLGSSTKTKTLTILSCFQQNADHFEPFVSAPTGGRDFKGVPSQQLQICTRYTWSQTQNKYQVWFTKQRKIPVEQVEAKKRAQKVWIRVLLLVLFYTFKTKNLIVQPQWKGEMNDNRRQSRSESVISWHERYTLKPTSYSSSGLASSTKKMESCLQGGRWGGLTPEELIPRFWGQTTISSWIKSGIVFPVANGWSK